MRNFPDMKSHTQPCDARAVLCALAFWVVVSLSPCPIRPPRHNIYPYDYCCSVHKALNGELHDDIDMVHADVHRLWARIDAKEVGK